jgi:hypothetical protein
MMVYSLLYHFLYKDHLINDACYLKGWIRGDNCEFQSYQIWDAVADGSRSHLRFVSSSNSITSAQYC